MHMICISPGECRIIIHLFSAHPYLFYAHLHICVHAPIIFTLGCMVGLILIHDKVENMLGKEVTS